MVMVGAVTRIDGRRCGACVVGATSRGRVIGYGVGADDVDAERNALREVRDGALALAQQNPYVKAGAAGLGLVKKLRRKKKKKRRGGRDDERATDPSPRVDDEEAVELLDLAIDAEDERDALYE